jgi:hypothetical protein
MTDRSADTPNGTFNLLRIQRLTALQGTARFLHFECPQERVISLANTNQRQSMASDVSGTAALEVWPRAVMATLLLLISLLTAHLVQLTWFGDPEVAAVSPHDLAQQP